MKPLAKWGKALGLVGMLVLASVTTSFGKEPWEVGSQDGDAIWVGFSMTPQVPRLGETAEVVGKVVAATFDAPETEIFFGDGKGNLIGVELVNCKQRFTTSLKRGVPKEFRYRIKFVGSPAVVQVYANARYYRESDGSIVPDRVHGGAGYRLAMNKKTKEFRMPGLVDQQKDPFSDLQEELGLPQGGYWYSVTVSLSFDIKEYAKQRKQSEEEVIKLLKAKAEALAKQRKIKKEEAYRVISKERLLWKDAGIPDPFYRSLEQQQKDSRLRPMKDPSPEVATRVSGYWNYDDHKYDWQTGLQKSPGDTFTPSALIILVLALILGILFSASKAINPFRTKEEQQMKSAARWINLGVLVGLLLLVTVSTWADMLPFKVEPVLNPQNPRLGETAELAVKVYSYDYDIPQAVVRFVPQEGIQLVSGSETHTVTLKKGVWQEVKFKVKFVSAGATNGSERVVMVSTRVVTKSYRTMEGELFKTGPDSLWSRSGYGLVLDDETKQFYRYPAGREKNPNEGLVKELGLPENTYWYSVAAHLNLDIKDFVKVTGKSREEVIKLLKEKAQRIQQKRKVEKVKAYDIILRERLLWKDAGLPDPRGPESMPKGDKSQGVLRKGTQSGVLLYDTGISGYWYYDDHKYNIELGLQPSTLNDTITPIRRCWVEIYDLGCPLYPRPRTFDGFTVTGSNGYFAISVSLPYDYQPYNVIIRVLTKGPSTSDVKFTVNRPSDGSTFAFEDTVVVWSVLGGTFNNLHVPRYSDPDDRQPFSGAWNIYDVMYRASLKTGYPSHSVKAIWDKAFDWQTSRRNDTIWVDGNYNGPGGGDQADEWHDDPLLHEYGHFAYWDWTNYQALSGPHVWYRAYPEQPNLAFSEGWAHFFSGVIRDSVLNSSWGVNDSLTVITNGRIGGGPINPTYWSFEEPWSFLIGSVGDPDSFKAGPWCEGAVCGSLFDIMDRYVENPYPPHPLLPEWPDTGVADTLRIKVTPPYSSSPYFNIVKNYRTLTGPVRKIYDFLAGWKYPPDPLRPGEILPSYGHWSAIKSILKHHRIPWIEPSRPLSIVVVAKAHPRRVRATWPSVRPLDQSSIQGYNLYRTVDGPSPKFTRLTPAGIVDTVYEDSTVAFNTTYRYFVTAVDTFGMESDSTLSEAVTTGEGIYDPLATAYNNAPKILRDRQRVLHVAYTDSGGCFYVTSSDSGQTWSSPLLIGPGRYPGLALDGRDSLYAVWSKPPGPAPDTEAQVLYSRRHGNGIWDPPVPLARYVMPGADIYGLSPAALAVQNDTARVVYECYNGTRIVLGPMYNWFYSIFHGTFPISAPQTARWQLLDSLHAVVPPHILEITSPGVAEDFNRMSHVVWHRLGKVCYREQIGDTLWKPLVDLSQSADWTSWHPSLNLAGNRLGVAWVLESETLFVDVIPPSAICYRSRLLGDTIWSVRETLSVGLQYATRPVLSEGPSAAFSASPTGGGPSEVYLTNRGTSGWTLPENVSNTIPGSNFPHLFTVQGASERVSDFLWTEGDNVPYEVVYRELSRPIPPRPWYEADVGQANPSPFTLQRDGYLVYGPLPYQTIDYDHQKLIYRFPGLDTVADYRLLLVAYFEKQGKKAENADQIVNMSEASDLASPATETIALESSKPKIEQIVLLNGVEVGRMELVPGVPDTFSLVIPRVLYQGGEVRLTLDKKKGRFASLSELYLYRWGAWGKKGAPSQGASQGSEGVTLLPKVYDLSQSYPNPAKEGLRINYALPKESQVSLKIYNVMGQLVRALREGKEKPGFYAATWDGKDQQGRRVASGVYLYRMEAGEFRKTRKMVVVR